MSAPYSEPNRAASLMVFQRAILRGAIEAARHHLAHQHDAPPVAIGGQRGQPFDLPHLIAVSRPGIGDDAICAEAQGVFDREERGAGRHIGTDRARTAIGPHDEAQRGQLPGKCACNTIARDDRVCAAIGNALITSPGRSRPRGPEMPP